MTFYKNPYFTFFPKIIRNQVEYLMMKLTSPLGIFSTKGSLVLASILSNVLLIQITITPLFYLTNRYTTVLQTYPVHTYPEFYFTTFFIGYILYHRQTAPKEPVMYNQEPPTIGYPKTLLVLLTLFTLTIGYNITAQNILVTLSSLLIGFIITYYYITSVAISDNKSKKMDVYKIEKWCPLTSGIFYTFAASTLVYPTLFTTTLGFIFPITVLLFYRQRIKKYNDSKSYTLDTYYERKGPTPEELSEKLHSLFNEKVLRKTPSETLEEHSKEIRDTQRGVQSMDELTETITHDTEAVKLSEQENEQHIQDIKWAWEETREEVNKHIKQELQSSDELNIETYTKADVQEFKKYVETLKHTVESFEHTPPNTIPVLERMEEKLDNTLENWSHPNEFEQTQ